MSATALVTTRIEPAIKAEAAIVLKSVGMTVSEVMRIVLTQIAKEHVLPFNTLIPNKTTIKAIKEARTKKLNLVNSVDELMVALNAKD